MSAQVALRTLTLAVFIASGGAGALGCGDGRGAASPSRALPTYGGRAASLFDDTIEPAAVGLDYERSYSAKADPLLRDRSQTSDAVLRVRVKTETALGSGPDASYQVTLTAIEKLGGEHPPPNEFTLVFDKTSESYGIVRSFETRLVGYPFIAFVKSFARPDAEPVLHFHLAPDTKDVRAAVDEALILEVLK